MKKDGGRTFLSGGRMRDKNVPPTIGCFNAKWYPVVGAILVIARSGANTRFAPTEAKLGAASSAPTVHRYITITDVNEKTPRLPIKKGARTNKFVRGAWRMQNLDSTLRGITP